MGFFDTPKKKEIKKVKLLGIRAAEQTKVFGTYNSSLYCLLVIYADNTRDLVECESEEFKREYLDCLEI